MEIGVLIEYLQCLEREYGSDLDVWIKIGDINDKEEDYEYGRAINIYHCKDARQVLVARPTFYKS